MLGWPTVVIAAMAAAGPPAGAPATCGHQSTASFPASSRDLVVGPLALVGGRTSTSAETVARFGGQKYPAVVRAGHRVVVQVRSATTALTYADRVHAAGGRTVADGVRVVDFRSCPSGRATSRYARRPATFWSGFILASAPRCVRLRVWVDGARTPRTARVSLGAACP